MHQGWPASIRDSATVDVAAAPPPDRSLTDVQSTNQAAIIALFRAVNQYVGNLAPMPGVFPDYKAPIVRNGAEGRELATARWGMPSSSKALIDATNKRVERLQAKGKTVDSMNCFGWSRTARAANGRAPRAELEGKKWQWSSFRWNSRCCDALLVVVALITSDL